MFTNKVRIKLARDYGIRDIPIELLEWLVWRMSPRDRNGIRSQTENAATVAFKIANEWQSGR